MQKPKRHPKLAGLRPRLMLLMALIAAVLSIATPALAAPRLTSVTVGAQTGALTAGTAGSVTFLVTVTKSTGGSTGASLSITTALPAGATYSFSPATLVWAGTATGNRTSTLTINTTAGTPAGATPFTVRATRTGPGNSGDFAEGQGTLTVGSAGPVAPTVSFGPAPSPSYPGANFTVSATTNSDGALTYSYVSGPCSLVDANAGTFSPTGTGTCVVQANTAATANFTAGSAQQNVAISGASGPQTPVITFDAAPSPVYPGPSFSVHATTNSDGALTYSYVSGPCSLVDANAGTFSPTGTGTCVVQAATAATANFLAGSAQQSVTISAASAGGTINLCAVTGAVTLPGAGSVPVWGFVLKGSQANCSDVQGTATIPGPVLAVGQGAAVTINVTNALPAGHTLVFEAPGIAFDAGSSEAAVGATVSRSFTASAPGTYLYESSGDWGRQEAMGLYGALIVRPPTAGQAYGSTNSSYDVEATLVLSQIDPNFNAAPDAFDMTTYLATYWLVNGKAYPDTAPGITAAAGQRLLLRYLNAGYDNTSMMLLGVHEQVLARDAHPLNNPFMAASETLPAGRTEDAIVTMPATAPPSPSGFALYNRNLHVTNGSTAAGNYATPGGMLIFLHP